jgi:sugar/nucleoside kinase (ribokinase family)
VKRAVEGLRIAAVGEIAEDRYLPEGARHLGGISANFARACARAGAHTLYGAVGDDDCGARLVSELDECHLELHVRVLEGATATQRIRLAPDGERIFCGFDAGVVCDYRLSPRELAELDGFRAVAVPCSPESRGVFDQCLATGVPLVADFSQDSTVGDADRPESWIEPHASRLSIAFIGGSPDFVDALSALSLRADTLLVLTAGAHGAFAFARGTIHHQPSLAETIVDTTGCGDALQGAFTVRYLETGSIAEALRAGSEMAASVASKLGAAPQ